MKWEEFAKHIQHGHIRSEVFNTITVDSYKDYLQGLRTEVVLG